MRSKLGAVATVIVSMAVIAGCSQSPTSGENSEDSGADSEDGGAADALEEIYAEVEGLEGEDRLKKLEELAAEEDSAPTWYTSENLDDSEPLISAFEDEYGIEPEIYRASSSDVLLRVMQEADANYAGADVVSLNGPEMNILDREELLLPLEISTRDDIFEGAQFDTWLGIYLNVFTSAWNTDALDESEYPSSWEDVLTGYPGDLAMEVGDWDWFATLVEQHFMAEEGMSEDEAVDLFREAASQAVFVDGHTTMAELMAAGEFDLVSSAYQHRISQLETEDGAPVAWEKPVEPVIVRPNGIGIHRDTDAPATSLLFIEYALSDGQQLIADQFRTPANTEYGGVPERYETVTVDLEKLNDERDRWEKLYEEVVRESKTDVIEED